MKRIISLILIFTLFMVTSAPSFADGLKMNKMEKELIALEQSIEEELIDIPGTNYIFDIEEGKVFKKLPEISEKEFEEAMEKALQVELAKIENKEESKLIEESVRSYLAQNTSQGQQAILGDLIDSIKGKIPNIRIKNKAVATAIDVIINATLVAIGGGTLAVALKKYGSKQLAKMFTKTLKTRILGKAAIALGISIPVLCNIVMYVVDPAAHAAKWLDSSDDDPNNGYLDVIWSKH